MAKNIDFNKIKNEIDNRKKERNMVSSRLGENVGRGIAPRDEFLNGLISSLHTGQQTASTNLIKVVENTTAARQGETAKLPINEIAPAPVPQQRERINLGAPVDMSPERDEQLFMDLEKKRKQTLAESMGDFVQRSNPNPMGGYPQNYYTNPNYGAGMPMPQTLNEGMLVESVKRIVDSYMGSNLAPIIEEAFKNAIVEMYAVERIKDVLNENKDLIKSHVYEVIKELQNKSKANKAQS